MPTFIQVCKFCGNKVRQLPISPDDSWDYCDICGHVVEGYTTIITEDEYETYTPPDLVWRDDEN